MKKLIFLSCLALLAWPVHAQQLLTLEESINRAIENNLALKSLLLEAEAARVRVKQAYASFLPQVNASSAYTNMEVPAMQEVDLSSFTSILASIPGVSPAALAGLEDGFAVPTEYYDTKIQVVLPVFLGGKRFKGIGMARLEQEIREDALAAEKKNTVLHVKEVYYNLLKIGEAVSIGEENLELVNSHLAEARNLMEKGVYTRSQVLHYEVQVKEAEQRLQKVRHTLETARLRFADLLDMAGTDFSLEPPTDAAAGDVSRKRAVRSALENRIEVKQLAKAVALSEKGIGLARSGFLPNFNLVYSYGWKEEEYAFKDDYWMFAASLDINIFAGGGDYLKLREAKVKVERAKNELEKLKRGVALQTENAFLDYEQSIKDIEVARERLEAAEESYGTVSKSFEQGIVNELTEKDARLGLANARISVAAAKYDRLIARAKLDNAMGVAE